MNVDLNNLPNEVPSVPNEVPSTAVKEDNTSLTVKLMMIQS